MKQRKSACIGTRIAACGLLGALAVVIAVAESVLLPAMPFLPPGAKLGLSNIVTVFAVSFFSFGGGECVTLCKAVFALLTRGGTAGVMSLCGGMLSLLSLGVTLRRRRQYSYIGVSVIAAICHNAGQLLAAMLLSGTFALLHYGKYLLLLAVPTGLLTGILLNIVMPRLCVVYHEHFKGKDAHT